MKLLRSDAGSTIPLLLGFAVIAFLVVAGSIAAGDAFVQQQDLQETCDGAAAAAASSADFVAARSGIPAGGALPLANVQESVALYLARDPSRASVMASAAVVGGTDVAVVCTSRTQVAFGSMFGFGGGIEHRVRSTARAPILGP